MLKRAPFTHHDVSVWGHASMLTCKQAKHRIVSFQACMCLFYPLLAVTHYLLPSRKSQECLWEEKEQNRLILQYLEGGNGLQKLCLP